MSMLQLHVLTIFPEILISPLQESILKRAQEKRLVRIDLHNLRQYTTDLHRTTDDAPYGGGPGMIMKAEPLVHGLDQLRTEVPELHTILTCPQGRLFTQQRARELRVKKRYCSSAGVMAASMTACGPTSTRRCRSATMC